VRVFSEYGGFFRSGVMRELCTTPVSRWHPREDRATATDLGPNSPPSAHLSVPSPVAKDPKNVAAQIARGRNGFTPVETGLRKEIEFRMGVELKRIKIGGNKHYGFQGISLR
jgi:hypothetical protein